MPFIRWVHCYFWYSNCFLSVIFFLQKLSESQDDYAIRYYFEKETWLNLFIFDYYPHVSEIKQKRSEENPFTSQNFANFANVFRELSLSWLQINCLKLIYTSYGNSFIISLCLATPTTSLRMGHLFRWVPQNSLLCQLMTVGGCSCCCRFDLAANWGKEAFEESGVVSKKKH